LTRKRQAGDASFFWAGCNAMSKSIAPFYKERKAAYKKRNKKTCKLTRKKRGVKLFKKNF